MELGYTHTVDSQGDRVDPNTTPFARPYVVSWNLTYRCNLACEHCYLDAGGAPLVGTENFADRSELGTEECFRVIDEIAAFAPECVTILTGGEPLLRRDILEIVRRAAERGLWVVVGTNGVSITENLARRLAEAGARGLSLSLDALDPDRHDRFRKVRGAWRNTVEGAEILNRTGLPFIVQTTAGSHNLGELDAIADFAHDRLAAKVWNLYFLVPTGRGQFVSDITPAQYDEVLASLYRIQRKYDRRMLVNAKCAPHYIKTVLENAAADRSPTDADRRSRPDDQDLLRRGRRVPGGDALHGDTAERGCHPLPLPPGLRGDSSQLESRGPLDVLGAVRRHSPPHLARRAMRGVRDERPLRGLPRPGLRDDRRSDGRRPPLHPHPRHVRRVPPSRASAAVRSVAGAHGTPAIQYGPESPTTIAWDDAAAARMKKIPAFVRGMVVRAVEESCRKNGLEPRDRRRARADPRADADAEDLRVRLGPTLRRHAITRQVPRGCGRAGIEARADRLPCRSTKCEAGLPEGVRCALLLDLFVHPLLELLGGLDGDESPHPEWPRPQSCAQAISYWNSGFPVRVRISAVVTVGTNQMGIVRPGMASCFTRNSGTPKLWMTSLLLSLTMIGLFTGR